VKVAQNALLDANDKQKSVKHGEETDRAISCLWYVRDLTDDAREIRLDLEPIIHNTDERNYAFFTYNDQLGGEIFSGIPYDQRASTCTFDVTSLPN